LSAAAAGGHVEIANLCIPRELLGDQTIIYLDLPRSKSKGWGPLHWAASNGHLAMSQLLIEKGISVKDEAFDGSTASDLARRHGHDEILQLLESAQQEPLNVQPNLEDQEQTQHDLELTGTLLSTALLCIKANFS
jgi:ankyrin repeat protein